MYFSFKSIFFQTSGKYLLTFVPRIHNYFQTYLAPNRKRIDLKTFSLRISLGVKPLKNKRHSIYLYNTFGENLFFLRQYSSSVLAQTLLFKAIPRLCFTFMFCFVFSFFASKQILLETRSGFAYTYGSNE